MGRTAMRPAELRTRHIRVEDHAFASGPVFLRPGSFVGALRRTRGWRSARLLMAVWRTFDQGATLGSRLRLGCGARLVNPNGPAAAGIGDDCVVRGILRLEAGGRLAIGDDVYIGDGCIVSAMASTTTPIPSTPNSGSPISARSSAVPCRGRSSSGMPRCASAGAAGSA